MLGKASPGQRSRGRKQEQSLFSQLESSFFLGGGGSVRGTSAAGEANETGRPTSSHL